MWNNNIKTMITISDILKNSFSISIEKNIFVLQTRIFAANGLKPIPHLMLGCMDKHISPPQRCTQSHISIVCKAKKLGLPFVVVFEDDAYPCINCAAKLENVFNQMPNDAQMLLLGWSSNIKGTQRFNSRFNAISTYTISGSHAYVLRRESYDTWLDFFKQNPNATADNRIFQVIPHSYILDNPLFIQYSCKRSMNNHIGYIFYGNHACPPIGFNSIEQMLKNA